jgi:hypothetical protein
MGELLLVADFCLSQKAGGVSILNMRNKNFSRSQARGVTMGLLFCASVVVFTFAHVTVRAASWKGLEPFVSKRADVERVLGVPIADRVANDGSLQFNVSGGKVTVFFVTAKFVATKKLSPDLEGTVLQIVLQHERATDTPASLNVVNNSDFERQRQNAVEVFTNAKEGIIYTFVDSKLKTTRYSYSSQQLSRIQRGN